MSPSLTVRGSSSSNDDSDTNIYFYNPSMALAVVFSVLYFLHIVYHFYLSIWVPCIRQKVTNRHRYTIPYFVAAVISTFGYSVRIASVSDKSNVTTYAISSSYVVIAPIFVCASLYWMVSRLIAQCLPDGYQQVFFKLRPKVLGTIFIISDVVSFLTQGAGSGIASADNWTGTTEKIGTAVLITGLALQFATFSLYLIVLGTFCQRVKRGGGGDFGEKGWMSGMTRPVKKVVLGMWIGSAFVWVRSLYRLIEFGLGINGYPFTHEWMLWVFEAAPMWIALAVLGWFHPVKWLQPSKSCGPIVPPTVGPDRV